MYTLNLEGGYGKANKICRILYWRIMTESHCLFIAGQTLGISTNTNVLLCSQQTRHPNMDLCLNILHYCSRCQILGYYCGGLTFLCISYQRTWQSVSIWCSGHETDLDVLNLGASAASFCCVCPCDVVESILCERFSDDLEQKQREGELLTWTQCSWGQSAERAQTKWLSDKQP